MWCAKEWDFQCRNGKRMCGLVRAALLAEISLNRERRI
jgi:hypothetical protein